MQNIVSVTGTHFITNHVERKYFGFGLVIRIPVTDGKKMPMRMVKDVVMSANT
jgi:hypothetical protein